MNIHIGNPLVNDYNEILKEIAVDIKGWISMNPSFQEYYKNYNDADKYSNTLLIGKYLGEYYYTGVQGDVDVPDVPVEVKVDSIGEYINNELTFNTNTSTSSYFTQTNDAGQEPGKIITNVLDYNTPASIDQLRLELEKSPLNPNYAKEINFNVVLGNKDTTGFLIKGADTTYDLFLTKVLTPEAVEKDMNYESYLAEILGYSIATGRRDTNSIPDNLLYRNSENTQVTLNSGLNELDETWAETIKIYQPTGEDKITGVEITIIIISSMAVLAGGIAIIKKYVVSKK